VNKRKAFTHTKIHKEEHGFPLRAPSSALCLSVKKKKRQPHTKPQRAQRFTKKKQAKPHPDPLQREREKKKKDFLFPSSTFV